MLIVKRVITQSLLSLAAFVSKSEVFFKFHNFFCRIFGVDVALQYGGRDL